MKNLKQSIVTISVLAGILFFGSGICAADDLPETVKHELEALRKENRLLRAENNLLKNTVKRQKKKITELETTVTAMGPGEDAPDSQPKPKKKIVKPKPVKPMSQGRLVPMIVKCLNLPEDPTQPNLALRSYKIKSRVVGKPVRLCGVLQRVTQIKNGDLKVTVKYVSTEKIKAIVDMKDGWIPAWIMNSKFIVKSQNAASLPQGKNIRFEGVVKSISFIKNSQLDIEIEIELEDVKILGR